MTTCCGSVYYNQNTSVLFELPMMDGTNMLIDPETVVYIHEFGVMTIIGLKSGNHHAVHCVNLSEEIIKQKMSDCKFSRGESHPTTTPPTRKNNVDAIPEVIPNLREDKNNYKIRDERETACGGGTGERSRKKEVQYQVDITSLSAIDEEILKMNMKKLRRHLCFKNMFSHTKKMEQRHAGLPPLCDINRQNTPSLSEGGTQDSRKKNDIPMCRDERHRVLESIIRVTYKMLCDIKERDFHGDDLHKVMKVIEMLGTTAEEYYLQPSD